LAFRSLGPAPTASATASTKPARLTIGSRQGSVGFGATGLSAPGEMGRFAHVDPVRADLGSDRRHKHAALQTPIRPRAHQTSRRPCVPTVGGSDDRSRQVKASMSIFVWVMVGVAIWHLS